VILALDIDGTLADNTLLAELFRDDPEEWHEEVAAGRVMVLEEARAELSRCNLAGQRIVFVTSRSEELREPTAAWLNLHFHDLPGALYMRSLGDRRPGWQVKADHLNDLRGEERVVMVDDDWLCRSALRPGDHFLLAPCDLHRLPALLQGG
jgi:hypothetical protein